MYKGGNLSIPLFPGFLYVVPKRSPGDANTIEVLTFLQAKEGQLHRR